MTTLPQFEAFFTELHNRAPFPWQRRLADEVLTRGWPAVLDLPTGVGKTSALDIALYCLAVAPERMPRRVVLVVDRRIVVDQGAAHAHQIRRKMAGTNTGPVALVADQLRRLWDGRPDEAPFAVAVMRGGMPRDNDWARRPDQPLLGVSTVDQLGSRLLFRGYGVSPRSAPLHAGLLGNDTLILLDEVHLANAFSQTLDAIKTRFRHPSPGLPDRFMVVQMSATVRASATPLRTLGLEDEDRAHPVLAQRLRASKRASLRVVKVTGDEEPKKLQAVAARAVHDAITLQGAGARVIAIVVNRVDSARMARRLLDEHRDTTDAVLVTGRMRPIERDHVVRTVLLPRAGAGRTRTPSQRPLIVVATQCIEAGADLDFDAMVTECASLDALRQRFGRVDRRGELASSTSVVLCRSDQLVEDHIDPVYGESLRETWKWMVEHSAGDEIDFGVSSLPAACDETGQPRVDLLAPVMEAPILLPAHLDAWAQTSRRLVAEPDVAMWLHGPQRPGADVQIVWRASSDVTISDPGRVIERLQACRPSTLEAVTVPLSAARRWLDGFAVAAIADVEGEDLGATPRSGRDAAVRAPSALRWNGDDSEVVPSDELRPGDVLVVDIARGGLWESSFDPTSDAAPLDLGDLAQLRGRAIATLRLQADALALWGLPREMLDAIPAPLADEVPSDQRERVLAWLALWPEDPPASPLDFFVWTEVEWRAARTAWRSKRLRVTVVDELLIVTAPSQLEAELDDTTTEDDDSSFRQAEVTLATHSADVRGLASGYARMLGFDTAKVEDLALAAWLHDVGKADRRFQRWLVGGSEVREALLEEPLAKSALPPGNVRQRQLARERAGYPAGYRHEVLSLAMVQGDNALLRDAHDRDLVLHLVASHHGWCRPFPPPIADAADLEVQLQHGDHLLRASTCHGLARLDSGVASRFWRLVARYGWWGLAWMEAVLRLADHRASEQRAGGVS